MLLRYSVPLSPQEKQKFSQRVPNGFGGDRGGPSGPAEPRPTRGPYDAWTGSGELDPFPARGEELADLAPLRTGREFRASLCYTVTEVRDLTA